MGINLHQIGQSLGLVGPSQSAYTASQSPVQPVGVMQPSALLGAPQPAPAAPSANPDPNAAPDGGAITVTGTRPQAMSPDAMGMPGMPNTSPANPQSLADLRQQLQDKADMARQIYHSGTEFGTHGILRDIIGNAEDFGRRLLGFAPRYNDEKWAERAYGMTSTDPNVAAAATQQAMQYNPQKTEQYEQQINQQKAQMLNAQAMSEYRNSMAQTRLLNQTSGYGSAMAAEINRVNQSVNPNDPGSIAQAQQAKQAIYERYKPVLNAIQAQMPGGGATLPDQYQDGMELGLMQNGYTGTNVQRAVQSAGHESAEDARNSARIAGQERVANIRGQYYVQGQGMAASSREKVAQMPQRAPAPPPAKMVQTIESGSILHPTKTQTTTYGGAAPAGGGTMHSTSKSGRDIYSHDGGRTWSYKP